MYEATVNYSGQMTARFIQEHVGELAEKIANLPTDHHDYKIIVADLIKRYVHQEKRDIYQTLKTKTAAREVGGYLQDYLTNMTASEDVLAKTWQYGTPNSCARFELRPKIADALSLVFETITEENWDGCAVYVEIKDKTYLIDKDGYQVVGSKKRDYEWIRTPLTTYEEYLYWKCYLKCFNWKTGLRGFSYTAFSFIVKAHSNKLDVHIVPDKKYYIRNQGRNMICPVCNGAIIKTEDQVYDEGTRTKCTCQDCQHEFDKENALPYSFRLPSEDEDHHE